MKYYYLNFPQVFFIKLDEKWLSVIYKYHTRPKCLKVVVLKRLSSYKHFKQVILA